MNSWKPTTRLAGASAGDRVEIRRLASFLPALAKSFLQSAARQLEVPWQTFTGDFAQAGVVDGGKR